MIQFLRKFKGLATFNIINRFFFKTLAALTLFENRHFDYTDLCNLLQRCIQMPGFSTTLTYVLLSLTPRNLLSMPLPHDALELLEGSYLTRINFCGGSDQNSNLVGQLFSLFHPMDNHVNFFQSFSCVRSTQSCCSPSIVSFMTTL